MFNKEGIPFFIIIIPFLSLVYISFFSVSYYMKLSSETNKQIEIIYQDTNIKDVQKKEMIKEANLKEKNDFIDFFITITFCILFFMALFTFLMTNIVNDTILQYKQKVKTKEASLKELNKTLSDKVAKGIEEGKQKDRAMLNQAKLARLGSMISMIAHQWRQPLSELSGVLMKMEMASNFDKLTKEELKKSLNRGNDVIEYMSNTIDDFRNFYKPDKIKSKFLFSEACKRALNLARASLKSGNIKVHVKVDNEMEVFGYPTEFSQAVLNILINAKDILLERNIENPCICIDISVKNEEIILLIKDNAGGIDAENLELIFDPYFSTKDSSKGTGLGLYISKLIVERNMNGSLHVNNIDKGACFEICVKGVQS